MKRTTRSYEYGTTPQSGSRGALRHSSLLSKKTCTLALVLGSIVFATSGCSVYMAAHQPDQKDLSLLNSGTPRMLVVSELGTPKFTEQKNGKRTDLYMFKQGYSSGAKVGRAFFHGAADVFTLGLWEVIGTPVESYASGTETTVQVVYDAEDKIETYRVLKGAAETVGESEPVEEY